MASGGQEVAITQGAGPGHTHVTLQHELLAAADAEQDALALLHLRLLHRVDLIHGEQRLLGGQVQPSPQSLHPQRAPRVPVRPLPLTVPCLLVHIPLP